jgi:hypothetical protein
VIREGSLLSWVRAAVLRRTAKGLRAPGERFAKAMMLSPRAAECSVLGVGWVGPSAAAVAVLQLLSRDRSRSTALAAGQPGAKGGPGRAVSVPRRPALCRVGHLRGGSNFGRELHIGHLQSLKLMSPSENRHRLDPDVFRVQTSATIM